MALSPQRVRDTNFKSAKRGYDQADVNAFVEEVAVALETAQNEATAMEARARAAVARLQELSQQAPAEAEEPTVRATVDESETISRTMLLAQRTADATVAEAQAEADRVLATARDEATAHLDSSRQEATRLIEESKVEARRAGESERVRVEGEVQALLARRDFLESDVDHLAQHLVAQRERIVEAVATLTDLVNRVPDGLADMRRPLLSAAAESPSAPEPDEAAAEVDDAVVVVEPDDEEDPFDVEVSAEEERSEISEITRIAEATPASGSVDATPTGSATLFAEDGEPTEQLDVIPRDR